MTGRELVVLKRRVARLLVLPIAIRTMIPLRSTPNALHKAVLHRLIH